MSSSAIILGLESSCDETAAALVATDRRILAQRIAGQEEAHRPFGGVVPEIAERAHVEVLAPLISQVMNEAGMDLEQIDATVANETGRALSRERGGQELSIGGVGGQTKQKQ